MSKKIQALNLDEEVIELLKSRAGVKDRSISAEANRILKRAWTKKELIATIDLLFGVELRR